MKKIICSKLTLLVYRLSVLILLLFLITWDNNKEVCSTCDLLKDPTRTMIALEIRIEKVVSSHSYLSIIMFYVYRTKPFGKAVKQFFDDPQNYDMLIKTHLMT